MITIAKKLCFLDCLSVEENMKNLMTWYKKYLGNNLGVVLGLLQNKFDLERKSFTSKKQQG